MANNDTVLQTNRRPIIWLLAGVTALLMAGGLVYDVVKPPDRPVPQAPDPEMQAAMQQARDTFTTFIEAFRNPSISQSFFSVKVPYRHQGLTKHVWLTDLSIAAGQVRGLIERSEKVVPVTGPVSGISDWMIIDDGVLRGGYTTRLLRERMTEEEKEVFDREAGFRLDP